LGERIDAVENLGNYLGAFDNYATPQEAENTVLPTNISSFTGIATLNDFATIRADETRSGATTRYIITEVDESGNITWAYDVTYSTDISGKIDKAPTATVGNFAVFTTGGGIVDSAKSADNFIMTGKFGAPVISGVCNAILSGTTFTATVPSGVTSIGTGDKITIRLNSNIAAGTAYTFRIYNGSSYFASSSIYWNAGTSYSTTNHDTYYGSSTYGMIFTLAYSESYWFVIRKYDGMLIVITQNIKDFAGTPEIARKSTAIINVSQYSLIFSLSPNDMNDLCGLYEKAGEINKSEQASIVYNPRGRAFFIYGAASRTNIGVTATPYVESLFM
jgi:hypothetical protein